MKAMSLRIRMQTLSPCLTPSFCRPPAMRSARSATSIWLRLRRPLMMPRKGGGSVMAFSQMKSRHPEERAVARVSKDEPRRLVHPSRLAEDGSRLRMTSNVGETRRALVDIGADRLELIGFAHQFHLLDGLGKQRRTGVHRQIVEHALGGADRFRTLARDFPGDLEGRGARIVADPGREAVADRLLRRENPPGIGQLAQDIVAHQ